MGAWTSTFTIGITLAYAPSIIHQPFLQLKDVSIPNQPIWAKDQARTGHPDLGKVVLYQMSYSRLNFYKYTTTYLGNNDCT